MFEALREFGRWLGRTELSASVHSLLVNTFWLAPSVQTLHILSIAVVILAAGVIGLRLLGLAGTSYSADMLVRRFAPLIWCALVVMLLTGGMLIMNRPGRYFGNWSFLTKMTLVLFGAGLVLAMQRVGARNPVYFDGVATRSAGKVLGAVLVVVWVAVIFAGRWIAYA
jgi:uncharacterized membrane protein